MFIPRTLQSTDAPRGRGPLLRAILVGAVLAIGLFAVMSVSVGGPRVDLQVGDVAVDEIRAPRALSFISESQTEAARAVAAAAVEAVYEPIAPPADISDAALLAYDTTGRLIAAIIDRRDDGTLAAVEVPAAILDAVPGMTEAQVTQLATMGAARWASIAEAGRTVLEAAMAVEVRDDQLAEVHQTLRDNVTNDLAQEDRELAGDLAAAEVTPNTEFSEAETAAAREAARRRVQPVVVEVQEGQTLVRAGDPITVLDLEKLEQLGLTQRDTDLLITAGQALTSVVLAALLVAFLWRYEPAIFFRNRSLLLFVLALFVSAVAIRIAADRALWAFVAPTAATVLLVGILLSGAAGAAMAVALAVLAGVMNHDAFEPAAYVLAGGMAALLSVARAERINVFVRTGVVLALTNIGVLTSIGLLEGRDLTGILQGAAAGTVNAGLSIVLAVGSFAVLGNLFGIMTVFQLLELANPSSRLLRRLLLEVPGTYHHSVMVGNLAERAAETIGADPLLARVAAYYHDIGKMKNPLAFIENQAGSRNIHDELHSEVSARTIAAHIRDGIDLGYEYGLPVQIIGYIPQHHGTGTMSYFYGKALDEAAGRTEAVDRDLYRYPGPKPQSREAAILMLADSVEASVRSLDEKDEASIRAMVDRIVEARVADGQLDEADLTLRDLAQIREAFVQQLLGMYHSRIKYPDNVVPLESSRRDRA